MRARRISAATFALAGATVGGASAALFLHALSSSPQTSIVSFEMKPSDIALGSAVGAAAFAVPWALTGAALGTRIAHARRRRDAVSLGALAAVAIACVSVGLVQATLTGLFDAAGWTLLGLTAMPVLLPFGALAAYLAWRRIRRDAAPAEARP